MVDMDGKPIEIPPWTTTSEGAATVITGMIDPCPYPEHNGSYLSQNAVSDHELHTHINDKGNWAKLWELSETLTQGKFSL